MTSETLWQAVFGTSAPVEIEIGPGRGVFLLASAAARPAHNFLAIERSHTRAMSLLASETVREHANVRVLEGDATCIVTHVLPADAVHAYHIGFPDPWWKRRHHRRRLFTEAFVVELRRTLVSGGCVHVTTDVADYFELMTRLLGGVLHREHTPLPRPVITEFERKARARGTPIHTATFRRVA